MLKNRIKELAESLAGEIIEVRRHIHANPELSYQEHNTAAFVQEKLESFGISSHRMAETGVVAVIQGKNPSKKVIALRADMDALPIDEQNEISYRSKTPGVMHACGHDVHTSCLLGAASILQQTRDDWEGTVKLIFQPGEEKNPGGASLLIKEGVLENPKPEAIIALHVNPQLQTGKLSFRGGKVMASADELYFTIRARGGHAAAPHTTADPIYIASQLIVSLQQLVSRNCNPFIPSVLTVTSFQGGFTTNVIPGEVKLMGTFRTMDEDWRSRAHEIIRNHSTALVESMGASLEMHIDVGYPAVYNNEELTGRLRSVAENFMGAENVEETELRMGAEDFGYYAQQIPGCFFRLGTGNAAKGTTHGVHTPLFNIDEDAIPIGMGALAFLSTQYLVLST